MNEANQPTEPNIDTSQASQPDAAIPATQPVVATNAHVPAGSASMSMKWLLVVLVVVLLGVGGWFGYRWWHNRSTKKTTASTATVKHDVALVRFGEGDTFSPTFYPGSTQTDSDADVTAQVFEGLTGFDQSTHIVPRLAVSWTNPDSSTWVFKLRQNVTFHSGRTMTADDVKASLEVPMTGDYTGFTDTIKSVTVVDPSTVKIVTITPDAILTSKLALLNIFDSKSGKKDDAINGTGPYVVKTGTTPSESEVDLVAFNKYWGGHAYTREIDYKGYDDFDKLVADLNAHKLDAGFVQTKDNADKTTAQGFSISKSPAIDVAELVPNSLKAGSSLAKLPVRQALALGLDPTAIMAARGVGGQATGQILTPQESGYNSAVKAVGYHPDQAKALLAAAGYAKGFTTSLTYFHSAQALADEVKTELAKINITLDLKPQTDAATTGSLAYGGKTDMYYNSISSTFNDAADIYAPVLAQSKNYSNANINTLYAQMQGTFDASKRLALLQQITKAAADDTAIIPLYTPDLYYVYASSLIQSRDISADSAGVYFSKVYQH